LKPADRHDQQGALQTFLLMSGMTVVQSQLGEYWQRYITSIGPLLQRFSVMLARLAGGANRCNVSITMAASPNYSIC
jgi:hypothetical protein